MTYADAKCRVGRARVGHGAQVIDFAAQINFEHLIGKQMAAAPGEAIDRPTPALRGRRARAARTPGGLPAVAILPCRTGKLKILKSKAAAENQDFGTRGWGAGAETLVLTKGVGV